MNKVNLTHCDLINLKLDLHSLNSTKQQLSNKNKIKLESIKRLEQQHEQKRLEFIKRIKFFDNFLLNDLNRKSKNLHKQIDSSRKHNQELDLEYRNLNQELNNLIYRKKKLDAKCFKYYKFFKFLNNQIILNYFGNDLSQIIDRYDSLTLLNREICNHIDLKMNELASIKNDLRSIFSTDYLVTNYENKNCLFMKLGRLTENILELDQQNKINIQKLNEKRVKNFQIELEISYLYNFIYLMKLNRRKSDSDNKMSHFYASSISLFDKLDIIEYNFIHFNEIVKLNV